MEILTFIFLIAIALFTMVIHEVSHGMAAYFLGDPTAKLAGRLTLNPLKHLDPIGSILLPGILILLQGIFGRGIVIGWAKPVPVNPFNLKDPKYGMAKVAAVGPGVNFLLAFLFSFFIRILPKDTVFFKNLTLFFGYIVWLNLLWAIFNLFPVPPFDGWHIFSALFPSLKEKEATLYANSFFLILIVILLMVWFVIPLIIVPLFDILTGLRFPI